MSAELIAILAVGVADLVLNGQRANRTETVGIRDEIGDLGERMAKLEGLLEGLREAISGRRSAV